MQSRKVKLRIAGIFGRAQDASCAQRIEIRKGVGGLSFFPKRRGLQNGGGRKLTLDATVVVLSLYPVYLFVGSRAGYEYLRYSIQSRSPTRSEKQSSRRITSFGSTQFNRVIMTNRDDSSKPTVLYGINCSG
jgi:hypothetical protein